MIELTGKVLQVMRAYANHCAPIFPDGARCNFTDLVLQAAIAHHYANVQRYEYLLEQHRSSQLAREIRLARQAAQEVRRTRQAGKAVAPVEQIGVRQTTTGIFEALGVVSGMLSNTKES